MQCTQCISIAGTCNTTLVTTWTFIIISTDVDCEQCLCSRKWYMLCHGEYLPIAREI